MSTPPGPPAGRASIPIEALKQKKAHFERGEDRRAISDPRAELLALEEQGELVVRGTLVIHATGRVLGKISYGQIEIARGGVISGQIDVLAGAAPREAVGAQATPAENPAPKGGSPPAPPAVVPSRVRSRRWSPVPARIARLTAAAPRERPRSVAAGVSHTPRARCDRLPPTSPAPTAPRAQG